MIALRGRLECLRTGANCLVPSARVRWSTEVGKAPEGFAVYLFHSRATHRVNISWHIV